MHSKRYKGKHLNVFQQMFRGVPYMSGSDPASKVVLGALALFIVVMGLSVSFTMFVVLATSASMLGFAGFLASWVLALKAEQRLFKVPTLETTHVRSSMYTEKSVSCLGNSTPLLV